MPTNKPQQQPKQSPSHVHYFSYRLPATPKRLMLQLGQCASGVSAAVQLSDAPYPALHSNIHCWEHKYACHGPLGFNHVLSYCSTEVPPLQTKKHRGACALHVVMSAAMWLRKFVKTDVTWEGPEEWLERSTQQGHGRHIRHVSRPSVDVLCHWLVHAASVGQQSCLVGQQSCLDTFH